MERERMEYYGELEPPKKMAQSPPQHYHRRHQFPKMQVLAIFSAAFFLVYSPLFYLQLKPWLDAVSVHSLGYSSNKNCMFLLCNGILVILVKSSGLIQNSSSSPSPSPSPSLPQSSPQKPAVGESSAGSSPEVETEDAAAEVGALEQGNNAGAPPVEVEVEPEPEIRSDSDEIEGGGSAGEMEAEICVSDEEEEDIDEEEEEEEGEMSSEGGSAGERQAETRVSVSDEEEDIDEEEEEEEGEMSSEEFYRKCEDFIQRMRGEINFKLNS